MTDAILERIADRIRIARAENGLSRRQLSERVGISYQTLFKYETAINAISASRLVRIAQAVNLPLSFFFEDIDLPRRRNARRTQS
jgi:transcriptional regulator with XRE-family HTH domain